MCVYYVCAAYLYYLYYLYILIKLCTSYKYIFLMRSKLKMYKYVRNWRIPEWEVVLGTPDE